GRGAWPGYPRGPARALLASPPAPPYTPGHRRARAFDPAHLRSAEARLATTRVIRCGTLFDGTGAAPVRDALVAVEDGKIAAALPPPSTPAPPATHIAASR